MAPLHAFEARVLLDALKKHPDAHARCLAALDLSRCTGKEVVRGLAARLARETSEEVRAAITSALISIGNEEVVRCCAALLKSRRPGVRRAASEVLQVLEEESRALARRLLEKREVRARLLGARILRSLRAGRAL